MGFFEILYGILISPLQLLFETVFSLAYRVTEDAGITIVVMSLAINFLVLPLYKRADAMQEEERDMQKRLHEGVSHIKKSFRGDERMLILQTYYRQNGYKPTYVLRGAVSLFLEIPFFIAAYQFLSHLSILEGVSFGPVADLGSADALITVGGLCINVLPILMTAVNIISTAIFTSGHPLKTKLQLYGMALFFLIFLYTSPAGLVMYWTLNNIFSLLKTIYYKFGITERVKALLRISNKEEDSETDGDNTPSVFVVSIIAFTVMIGLLIPSTVIASAPSDFINPKQFLHPLWYIVSAFCLAAGTFIVWINVFYRLASKKGKITFGRITCGLFAAAMLDYMLFSKSFGVLSETMQYDDEMAYGLNEILIDALAVALALVAVCYIVKKWGKTVAFVLTVCVIAMCGMSIANIVKINSEVSEVLERSEANNDMARISLGLNGKNVVVLMLDRAQGQYLPYILEEKPELKEKFSGFTYYSNTISYGSCTNVGSPSLYGGHEYTPYEINKRDDVSLADKQNEALKIMPTNFSDAGYDVTICDPTYAGYKWIPDLSIFNDHPEYHTYITNGMYVEDNYIKASSDKMNRNFFCFAIMKSLPLAIQPLLYDEGEYCNMNSVDYFSQTPDGHSIADGINRKFMNSYLVLDNLSEMTDIKNDDSDYFLMMSNDTTHEQMMLQQPDYTPSEHVDNIMYETGDEFIEADGNKLLLEHTEQVLHYHINMAALLRLGEWFDFLKENNVYDNTRIILVADHGRGLGQVEDFQLDIGEDEDFDVSFFFPLLMEKDFGSKEFTISDVLMSNADVPSLALDGIVDNPINPFTGKCLVDDNWRGEKQYVLYSEEANPAENGESQFMSGTWYSMSDSIWNIDNWKVEGENTALPE